jgi:hypothetical protein
MPAKTQQARTARLLPDGVPRWIRCYDNGGETCDRYTVVFTGRYTHKTGGEHCYLGMSGSPFHPQGVCMHGSDFRQIDTIAKSGRGHCWPPALGRKNHLGKRIPFANLPTDCQRAVLQDYCELWNIPLPAKEIGVSASV